MKVKTQVKAGSHGGTNQGAVAAVQLLFLQQA
jgi:hypothetical protein